MICLLAGPALFPLPVPWVLFIALTYFVANCGLSANPSRNQGVFASSIVLLAAASIGMLIARKQQVHSRFRYLKQELKYASEEGSSTLVSEPLATNTTDGVDGEAVKLEAVPRAVSMEQVTLVEAIVPLAAKPQEVKPLLEVKLHVEEYEDEVKESKPKPALQSSPRGTVGSETISPLRFELETIGSRSPGSGRTSPSMGRAKVTPLSMGTNRRR